MTGAVVRLATAADAARVAAIYAPSVRDTAASFEVDVPDAREMGARIESVLERFPWLVHEDGGDVAGYAYAGAHRTRAAYQWSVDVTVYVDAGRRRQGVGRALYRTLLALLPLQGYVNAYAGITLPNPASVALHESVGFAPIGVYRRVGWKLGRWHDVGWWGRALAAPSAPPSAPLPLATVHDTPAWRAALAAAGA